MDDLFSFELVSFASRRKLLGTAIVSFDVRTSLSDTSFADATSFATDLTGKFNAALLSGNLTASVSSSCGCTAEMTTVTLSLIIRTQSPSLQPVSIEAGNSGGDANSGLSTAIVVPAVVIAVVILVAVIVGVVCFYRSRKQKTRNDEGKMGNEIMLIQTPKHGVERQTERNSAL